MRGEGREGGVCIPAPSNEEIKSGRVMIESITQESLLINTESSQLISRYAVNVRLIASHPT